MATASETEPTGHALWDHEFEELLQKTWDFVQSQQIFHPVTTGLQSGSPAKPT